MTGAGGKNRRFLKSMLVVVAIVAAVAAVRVSGAAAWLEGDRLRALVAAQGGLAPVLFVALYALAAVLFLPGLPLTVAAGLMFGPFWGVVYAITGATLGACLAFLVARYAARDWVASRLAGDKWASLDREVGKNGWKVVAVTRLVPLFPFNLLNYAFGLTSIPFVHYAVASFLCMLPACIAYVVFSSSLTQLLRGVVSPATVVGAGLVVVISLLPRLYRRLRK